jgi:CubicO group peptidase (beta-lactamase class C family)
MYKARDTRSDRTVAIKVWQEKFSERFEREARAVAALNHPNICLLYDVGPNYLVMELVEGSPLTPAESPRKLDKAARVATVYTFADGKLQPVVRPTPAARIPSPDSGLLSTAGDLARFNQMMLNTLNGKRVLSAAAVESMTTSYTGDMKAGHAPGGRPGVRLRGGAGAAGHVSLHLYRQL